MKISDYKNLFEKWGTLKFYIVNERNNLGMLELLISLREKPDNYINFHFLTLAQFNTFITGLSIGVYQDFPFEHNFSSWVNRRNETQMTNLIWSRQIEILHPSFTEAEKIKLSLNLLIEYCRDAGRSQNQ